MAERCFLEVVLAHKTINTESPFSDGLVTVFWPLSLI